VGMPTAITKVVAALAELRQSTPERIVELVRQNFVRLVTADPWFHEARGIFANMKS